MTSPLAIYGGPKAVRRPIKNRRRQVPWRGVGKIVLNALIDRNTVTRGGPIARVENRMARLADTRYALAMNSGTAALHSAFFAVGIKPGDEVIVPGYTFFASIAPILQCGGTPVLCDIDEHTLTADPDDVEQRITERTRAICVVHVWGNPAKMDRFAELAERHKLWLIEDCSHAPGASYQDRPVGGWGDVGCFSLQGKKAVTGGEAGAATTNNPTLFDRMLLLGHANRAEQDQVAATFRSDDMALGVKYRPHLYAMELVDASLDKLADLNARRRRNYAILSEALSDCRAVEPITTYPDAQRGGLLEFLLRYHPEHAGELNAGAFARAVAAEGVPLKVDRYSRIGHRASFSGDGSIFNDIGYRDVGGYLGGPLAESPPAVRRDGLPTTERLTDQLLALPPLTKIAERSVRDCARAIRKVAQHAPEIRDLKTGATESFAPGSPQPATA